MVYHPCGVPQGSIVGVFNGEGPPVPIPNTEVKLTSADNTCLETDREDRSMPTQKTAVERLRFLLFKFADSPGVRCGSGCVLCGRFVNRPYGQDRTTGRAVGAHHDAPARYAPGYTAAPRRIRADLPKPPYQNPPASADTSTRPSGRISRRRQPTFHAREGIPSAAGSGCGVF